jgi:dihydroxyacid dehydratase/phosphogluconate dehydratase
MPHNSDRITQGIDRAPHRSLLFATGVTRLQLGHPMIGLASSYSGLIPGHSGMRDLKRFIDARSGRAMSSCPLRGTAGRTRHEGDAGANGELDRHGYG